MVVWFTTSREARYPAVILAGKRSKTTVVVMEREGPIRGPFFLQKNGEKRRVISNRGKRLDHSFSGS